MTDASERFASFHARREAQVKEPMGSLALILTQWIDAPQEVWGVAGRWAPRGDNASGLELTASAEDGIQVNGRLIDGTVVIDGPGIADHLFRHSSRVDYPRGESFRASRVG
jgi:hypothetical protein